MEITIQISEGEEGIAVEGVQATEAQSASIEPPTELREGTSDQPAEMSNVEMPPAQFRESEETKDIVAEAEPAPPKFSPASVERLENMR